jgi:two-component system, sensor histidine kinase and response regulator
MKFVDDPTPVVPHDSDTAILVIDDRPANRALIRKLFSGRYRVLEAHDGEAGLAVARDVRPDCILLDVSMPGLSGFEVLERLAADPRTCEIPVIILTATPETLADMDRALRSGAVDYITKPIDASRVIVRVRGAIERSRLLREAHTLRANFTSMLVHDLRAPLTVIGGYADLMTNHLALHPDPKLQRYAGAIDSSVKRMLALIRQILDLSKVDMGKLTIERSPVDVSRLATDVVDAFQPAVRRRGIQLYVRGADVAHTVLGDIARLEQVLMNLLTNALKFAPAAGTIGVELCDEGSDVTVRVRDNGPGVPRDERPLLFEPFSQASAGRKATGAGLGLMMCARLVEAHGGRIWLDETAEGCCVAFSLPVRDLDRRREALVS